MLRVLPLFLLLVFQEPDVDELIRRLESSPPRIRSKAIEDLVAKGDVAEAALRKRLEVAPEASKAQLRSVLHRLELQRKLKEFAPTPELIDFEAVDRPLKEVLPFVERWMGLQLIATDIPENKVTLRLKKATSLEALDAFHAATGLYCQVLGDRDQRSYDKEKERYVLATPRARLVPGPHSTWPSCISGRYRISATEVLITHSAEQVPAGSAHVSVSIQAPYRTRPNGLGLFTVTRVADDKGRELALIPDNAMGSFGFPRVGSGPAPLALARTVRFQPPDPDAKSLTIAGKGRADFIVERTWLTFEDPLKKVGTTVESHGAQVLLKEFHPIHGWNRLVLDQLKPFDSRETPVEPYEYRGSSLVEFIEIVHENGLISYPENQGAGSEGGVYYRKRMTCFSDPKVTSIRLAVRSFAASEDFTFELRDIPLPGVK